MFARRVSMQLKPNSVAEFTQRIEKDILPLLRKQNGFRDEITFVAPGGTKRSESVCGITKRTQKLTTANVSGTDEVLARVVEGTPKVDTDRGCQLDFPPDCRRRSSLKQASLFVRGAAQIRPFSYLEKRNLLEK